MRNDGWRKQAACRGKPLFWWFDNSYAAKAREVCSGCPVVSDCLEWALREQTPHTNLNPADSWILGGLSWTQRKSLVRARQKARRRAS